MGKDALFDTILERLKEIHEEFPDLRFGLVLQNSVDMTKMSNNNNLNDKSSKTILSCLDEFQRKSRYDREKGKKVKDNDS